MTGQFSDLAVDGPIATVTLRRPECLNALHPAAHRELSAVFDKLLLNAAIRAVVVTGAGRAFCVGYDLKDNIETGTMELAPGGFAGLTLRAEYPLPLIAAVNGPAFGGGFELALACDLIVAAEEASFALPEPKVGWAALGGGVQRLPRAIGLKQAMGMILTGRAVSAAEGHRLGFVNEVVPRAELPVAAAHWARDIAACAPLAIRCSKQAAYASLDQPDFAAALDPATYPQLATVMASADAAEGKRAFVERRAPVWTGR